MAKCEAENRMKNAGLNEKGNSYDYIKVFL